MTECTESNIQSMKRYKYLSPLKDSNDASIARRSDLGDPIPYPSPTMEPSPTAAPAAARNDGADARSRPPVFTSPLSKDEIHALLLEEAGYDCTNPATALAKRTDYLSWDDYFMAIASLSAHRSKDPILPKGACLVDAENRVIGIGYNGFPRGCPDDLLPWQISCSHETPFLHTPSPYECHAEVNAILNKCSADVAGARMYVAHFPCKL
jgi:dCMP deaminase